MLANKSFVLCPAKHHRAQTMLVIENVARAEGASEKLVCVFEVVDINKCAL